jgi:hypothetical protein
MKFKKQVLVVGTLLALSAISKERFDIPNSYVQEGSVLPISYLEDLKIQNTKEKLSDIEKNKLSCLIIDAESTSLKLFDQSYMIKISSPIMKLFWANNPEFANLNWEGRYRKNGGTVLLTTISSFIKEQSKCENTK